LDEVNIRLMQLYYDARCSGCAMIMARQAWCTKCARR